MRVIDLSLYRAKKQIEILEKNIEMAAMSSNARELKLNFKKWLTVAKLSSK